MKAVMSLLLCVLLTAVLSLAAMAAPTATLQPTISDVAENEDGGISFVLKVAVTASAQPYAALDFDVISSNHQQLNIVNNSADSEEKDLEISFDENYGSAYHPGRIDEATGSIDYLLGIFAQNSENAIVDEVDICSIKFVYSGSEPQKITLSGLQLVYFDENKVLISEKLDTLVNVEINKDLLKSIDNDKVPLTSPRNLSAIYILIVVVLAAVAVAFLLWRRAKKL